MGIDSTGNTYYDWAGRRWSLHARNQQVNNMANAFLVLSIAAIVVMLYALYRVVTLRKKIPGGVVKKTWDFLAVLIVLFAVGYLSTPFFPMLPQSVKDLVVGVIFFFGAIFVVIVINLFYKVVSELGF